MNNRWGGIAYAGYSRLSDVGLGKWNYIANISSLFNLDSPLLGAWWKTAITRNVLGLNNGSPFLVFNWVFLGDPTIKLMGFDSYDFDRDGFENAKDTCPLLSNDEQYSCSLKDEIYTCLSNSWIQYLVSKKDFRFYDGVNELKNCNPDVMTCNYKLFTKYCPEIVGNACQNSVNMEGECVSIRDIKSTSRTVTQYESIGTLEIRHTGEKLEEYTKPTRTIHDTSSPLNKKVSSHYCMCGYAENLGMASSNDWIEDCSRYCKTNELFDHPWSRKDRGWFETTKWSYEDGSHCEIKPANEQTETLCGGSTNDPTEHCYNKYNSFWPANTYAISGTQMRQLDWRNMTLPGEQDMPYVDPATCWFVPGDINYSMNSRIVTHYVPTNTPSPKHSYSMPVPFSASQASVLHLSIDPFPVFPEFMLYKPWAPWYWWEDGPKPWEFESSPSLEWYLHHEFLVVNGKKFLESTDPENLTTGIQISVFDPLAPINSASREWRPTYYANNKFPRGLHDFSLTAGQYKKKDVVFLQGGLKEDGTINQATMMLAMQDDGRYVWDIFESRTSPAKLGSTLYFDHHRNNLWLFGGVNSNEVDFDGEYSTIDIDSFENKIYVMDITKKTPSWRRFEPAIDNRNRPRFANAKVSSSATGDIFYFYGGQWIDESGDVSAMPAIAYFSDTFEWKVLEDMGSNADLPECGTVVPDGSRFIYFRPTSIGGGTLYSYDPRPGTISVKVFSDNDIPDMSGGCHAIYVSETENLLILGKDNSAQSTKKEMRIDPDSLEIVEDTAMCDPDGSDNKVGMKCTNDDKWWQQLGELSCNPANSRWECDAECNDSKWYGTYFALSNINGIEFYDGKAYLATDSGLQIATLAIPYFPVFAGWGFTDGPANDIAFDGNRYAFVADQEGIRLYDVKFSLIPILKSHINLSKAVRALSLHGNLLYAVTSNEILVYDVSDVNQTFIVDSIQVDDQELTDVDYSDPYVYVSGQRGIYIVDFSWQGYPLIANQVVTSRAILKLKADRNYLYLIDDTLENQTYEIREDPKSPAIEDPHSVSGWINGVDFEEDRSVGYMWWWMEVRKMK